VADLPISGKLGQAGLGRFALGAESIETVEQISATIDNDMELSQAAAVITKYIIGSTLDNNMEMAITNVVALNFISAVIDNNMELAIANTTAFFRPSITIDWDWAMTVAWYGELSAEVRESLILGIMEPRNPAAYLESWRRDGSYISPDETNTQLVKFPSLKVR
jgi:hypothetical protein